MDLDGGSGYPGLYHAAPLREFICWGGDVTRRWDKMFAVLRDVADERRRQERKGAQRRAGGWEWVACADPSQTNEAKLAVLVEEVGEVARELCDAGDNLRIELTQVAAVCVAWIEALEAAD